MKFKFQFEKLLQHRKREEEIAMRDYLLARQRHDAAVVVLNSYYQSIVETRTLTAQVTAGGGAQSEKLRQADHFIAGQEVRIHQQKLIIRTLNQEKEEKHEIAVARAQDAKALEKLKEKLRGRHRIAANKRETKEMDDLATMRFRFGGENK
jgi:flagellar export protein FliJ